MKANDNLTFHVEGYDPWITKMCVGAGVLSVALLIPLFSYPPGTIKGIAGALILILSFGWFLMPFIYLVRFLGFKIIVSPNQIIIKEYFFKCPVVRYPSVQAFKTSEIARVDVLGTYYEIARKNRDQLMTNPAIHTQRLIEWSEDGHRRESQVAGTDCLPVFCSGTTGNKFVRTNFYHIAAKHQRTILETILAANRKVSIDPKVVEVIDKWDHLTPALKQATKI